METLVKEFPDNDNYLKDYAKLLKVDETDNVKLGEFYKDILTKYKSRVAHMHYLSTITNKEDLKQEFLKFVIPSYRKNIISLFREVKELYNCPKRSEWMGEVFSELEASLKGGVYPNGEVV
jgi:hypothetical protein